MNYIPERKLICELGRRAWVKGWGASNDGNLSMRIGKDLFLVTPANVSKGFMTPDMLVLVNENGNVMESTPPYRPTSEVSVHLAIYKHRDDVGGIMHAHPPVATAYAVANISLEGNYIPETAYYLGHVPVTPYALPGGKELIASVMPYLDSYDALLLGNHGALSLGHDLESAYSKMESVEYLAQLSMNIRIIGRGSSLPKERIQQILDKRAKENPPGRHPGYVAFTEV